jgi:predicted Kef-type K+ transport protein
MIDNNSGQLNIANMVMYVILVVLGVILSPIINDVVGNYINTSNATGTTLIILQSLVPMFWLGVIVTFFMFVTPMRQQQY